MHAVGVKCVGRRICKRSGCAGNGVEHGVEMPIGSEGQPCAGGIEDDSTGLIIDVLGPKFRTAQRIEYLDRTLFLTAIIMNAVSHKDAPIGGCKVSMHDDIEFI